MHKFTEYRVQGFNLKKKTDEKDHVTQNLVVKKS